MWLTRNPNGKWWCVWIMTLLTNYRKYISLTIIFETNVAWYFFSLEYHILSIYNDPIVMVQFKKNRNKLGNFETPQHTQKIDTSYFASFETMQPLRETIFHSTHNWKVISRVQVTRISLYVVPKLKHYFRRIWFSQARKLKIHVLKLETSLCNPNTILSKYRERNVIPCG